MKSVLKALGLAVAISLAIILVRTLQYESRQVTPEVVTPAPVDEGSVARHLADALQIRTISHSLEGPVETEALLEFQQYLSATYPLTARRLQREIINEYSLLYTWTGKNPELPAVLLLAHMDVVPVEPGSEGAWKHDPFAGEIRDGEVWGRGAMDDKGPLICLMESVEGLLQRGFQPERTVLLAFGHDEELGGETGAIEIAKHLEARGVRAMLVLDEGGAVTEKTIPTLDEPVALIGIAEKGSVSIDLEVETKGGHSSMPPRQSGIGVLSAAIVALEDNQVPGGLRGATSSMFDYLGPELPFPVRAILANRWLFDPLLERVFASLDVIAPMIRTTTAATIFNGGVKTNVLPSRVKATVNFRILPGDTIESVIGHVTKVIDDDRVRITPRGAARNPSPISPIDTQGFDAIHRSIKAVFPTATVAPYLVMGGTDSRYYSAISENLYRFAPFKFSSEDRKQIHGTNERIPVAALGKAVVFYTQLIEKAASMAGGAGP